MLKAHGLAASGENLCFLQKVVWIGESPWSHCPGEKHLSVISEQQGIFLGSVYSIMNITVLFCE